MDKMFTGFVAYGAPGPSGYTYCTATAAPQSTPASDNGTAANEDPLQSVEMVPMGATQHEIEIQQQPPHRVKQEQQEEKHNLVLPTPLPAPPQTSQAETQTCFPQVNVTYVDVGKKKVQLKHLAVEAAIQKANRQRNKVADPKSWSSNVRKTKHQRGEAYVSRRGKYVPERHVKTFKDCKNSCKLHCSQQLSDIDRQHIFKAFYSLSSNEKKHFLLNTTERHCTKKATKLRNDNEPIRKYSFKYFFLVRAVRYNVCKAFYLGTLAISQKPIYNVHAYKSDMNLPKPDGRGLAPTSAHGISTERKDRVREHISSFPILESSSSNPRSRKYLDSDLSVKKMHHMYVVECNKEGLKPVKESMYRKIFNTDFNLHIKKGPKNTKIDRCENCKHPIRRK